MKLNILNMSTTYTIDEDDSKYSVCEILNYTEITDTHNIGNTFGLTLYPFGYIIKKKRFTQKYVVKAFFYLDKHFLIAKRVYVPIKHVRIPTPKELFMLELRGENTRPQIHGRTSATTVR